MQFEINAQARTLQGSGASRRLRRAGKVPGIVYGGAAAPQAIEIDHNELLINLSKEAFHASILNIDLDGEKQQVLLRDVQRHAYKPLILHVDFQRVDATHELHKKVPLHFINAEIAPGVKLDGGMVNHVMTELDVQCLPKDLPAFIEVDLKRPRRRRYHSPVPAQAAEGRQARPAQHGRLGRRRHRRQGRRLRRSCRR